MSTWSLGDAFGPRLQGGGLVRVKATQRSRSAAVTSEVCDEIDEVRSTRRRLESSSLPTNRS